MKPTEQPKPQTPTQTNQPESGEIVLYQPNENIRIEVRLDSEMDTVWLTQQQIADLFATKRPAITKHLANIFKSGELDQTSTCSILEHMGNDGKQHYSTKYYNLDVIISVGYRVNSVNATAFRRWATSVLKDHLLRGYTVSNHLVALQERMDTRMTAIENTQAKQQEQLDFFIRTSTPPAEMVFFNGDFFTARVALESLIKTAKRRAIIIDHYIDAKTFDIFDVRQPGVTGIIYTQGIGTGMIRLRDEHNRQTNVQPVEVKKWRVEPHDRFLVIDDQLYHCGHSLNATGNKLSCIMLMGTSPETILEKME